MAWIIEVFDGGEELIWQREPDRGPVPVRDAHTGALFRARVACAECMADLPVVLTAEHGFLSVDDPISGPYDDPAFDRPGAVSVETLREQIRTQHLDELTVVLINVDDPVGRERVAAAFSETLLEIRFSPDCTVEEAIRVAMECAAACAGSDG